jgi:hypothetical protein
LPALDEMIDHSWPVADERPHLLLLNGDQIYADYVVHTVLFLLMDADKSLMGWSESLPNVTSESSLKPGGAAALCSCSQSSRRKIQRTISYASASTLPCTCSHGQTWCGRSSRDAAVTARASRGGKQRKAGGPRTVPVG